MQDIALIVFFLIGYRIGKHQALFTPQDVESIKALIPHKKAILLKKKPSLSHAEQVLKDLEK